MEGETERRRLCQTGFSQAGPRSHLLSSFKGVVMVTVAGSRGRESAAWYPCGLGCCSGDDGKASQLGLGWKNRYTFTTTFSQSMPIKVLGGSLSVLPVIIR